VTSTRDGTDAGGEAAAGIDHLFRRESGRLVATVTRVFGVHNLALAEDVVQDAFCKALEVWKIRGVPDNPAAWLMATAKHKALDALRRERTARTFAPDVDRLLRSEWTLAPTVQELFAEHAIRDDLLRMMFSCCDPSLAEEAQVALMLNILCGLSAGEIAGAFVITRAAAEKRITRAKQTLAQAERLFDLTSAADFAARLPAVQRALYLLFNEGYHGASTAHVVRAELCDEAMRLTRVLLDGSLDATPSTRALAALMYLNAARLPARLDASGNLHALHDQDRSRWDQRKLAEGLRLLGVSATGEMLTEYHLEAAIASIHAVATSADTTDWAAIATLYDRLLAIRPSPVVALSRAIAIGQHEGPERGLAEIDAIADRERLEHYPFYAAARGDFELRRGRRDVARKHYETALAVARNPAERRFLAGRIADCGENFVTSQSATRTPLPDRQHIRPQDPDAAR
jgi:RNA polymerase sigma-70 factor (ECF subfamily)